MAIEREDLNAVFIEVHKSNLNLQSSLILGQIM